MSRTRLRCTCWPWSPSPWSRAHGRRQWHRLPRSCCSTSSSSSRATRSPSRTCELINLFLLLFTGFVVGQLAARQRARAEDAIAREREARALFGVSRELATRASTPAVLIDDRRILRDEASMDRVWITLGQDRVAADTGDGRPPTPDSTTSCNGPRAMRRAVDAHPPGNRRVGDPRASARTFRVRMDAGTETYGSIWATRPRAAVTRRGARRDCSPLPLTRSGRPSARTASRLRRAPPRSPVRATRSSRPCSSRSRTTSGPRSRRSERRPGRFVRTVASTTRIVWRARKRSTARSNT